jgi:hypothetical protein
MAIRLAYFATASYLQASQEPTHGGVPFSLIHKCYTMFKIFRSKHTYLFYLSITFARMLRAYRSKLIALLTKLYYAENT